MNIIFILKNMNNNKKIEWEDRLSVGIKLIDDQHKNLFATINELIDIINVISKAEKSATEKKLDGIINQLMAYKRFHFATEERYFKEFNYEKADDHIFKHQSFDKKIDDIRKKNESDVFSFAFELVDFMEDWLIGHLMTTDQEYKECFKVHGLK